LLMIIRSASWTLKYPLRSLTLKEQSPMFIKQLTLDNLSPGNKYQLLQSLITEHQGRAEKVIYAHRLVDTSRCPISTSILCIDKIHTPLKNNTSTLFFHHLWCVFPLKRCPSWHFNLDSRLLGTRILCLLVAEVVC